jgi:hypothetical protein
MESIAKGHARTCLDCQVLPPWSVLLCPLHAAAGELLSALRDLLDAPDLNMDDMEPATLALMDRAHAAIANAEKGA